MSIWSTFIVYSNGNLLPGLFLISFVRDLTYIPKILCMKSLSYMPKLLWGGMDQDNLSKLTKLPLWLHSSSISRCKGLFYKISWLCFCPSFLSEISLSFVSVLLNFDYLFKSFSSLWDFAYKEAVGGQFWVFTRHRLLSPPYISLKTLALSCYWSSKIPQFQLLFLL